MFKKTILVVSDKFKNFTSRKDVITKSELLHILESPQCNISLIERTKLIPGQGFSDQDIENILSFSEKSKNAKCFDFSLWYSIPKRASRLYSHKHHAENTLISEPIRTSENEFTMHVLIDENCEMMRDHQTGLHVQGMLLLEASRQGYLAIFEKFLACNDCDKYFVFNNLQIDYNRFTFPLPAELFVSIQESDLSNSKKQQAKMHIKIMQCNTISASCTLDMSIMATKRMGILEEKLAQQSLDHHITHLLQQQSISEVAHA